MPADAKMEIWLTAKDMTSKTFGAFQSRIGTITRSVTSLKGALAALGVGYGLTELAKAGISVASSFEQMQIKLDALTNGRGRQTLEDLNAWAVKMPVNTQEAVDTFVMMQALGLDPTIDKMQTLVDVSAIFGDDAMPRVARALGQMQTLGKLSAEELNQLSEAGINARKYLTESFGMSVKKLQESNISIQRIIDAIWKGLNADYSGAAQASMKSWRGLVTTLESNITEITRQVMSAGVFDILKENIDEINQRMSTWIKNNEDLIKQKVPEYIDRITTSIQNIADIYQSLPDEVIGAAGYGIIGRILLGKGGGALTAAMKLSYDAYDNLLKRINDAIGDEEWPGMLPGFVDLFNDYRQFLSEESSLERRIEAAKERAQKNLDDMKNWRGSLIGEDTYRQQYEHEMDSVRQLTQQLNELQLTRMKALTGKSGSETAFRGMEMASYLNFEKTSGAFNKIKKEVIDVEEIIDNTDKALNKFFKDLDKAADRARDYLEWENKQIEIDFEWDEWWLEQAEKRLDEMEKKRNINIDVLLTGDFEELDKLGDKLKEFEKSISTDWSSAFTNWSGDFLSSLNDMVWGAETSFSDIATSFGKMITQMLIERALVEPLVEAYKSSLTSENSFWNWLIGSAQGNVFSGPGIGAYENKIVTKPTIFPFASGIGLMGEAGAEGIFPLARTPSGDLGVKAVGGGESVTININDYSGGAEVQRQQTQAGETIDITVGRMVANQTTQYGTSMNKAVRQLGGRQPLVVR